MARDFKGGRTGRRGGGFGSTLSFVTGLLVGLTVAAVVYFSGLGVRPPASEAGLAPGNATGSPEPIVQEDHSALAPLAGDAEAPPEPEFDFYTILPNTEVKVPEAELAEPAEPAPPPDVPQGAEASASGGPSTSPAVAAAPPAPTPPTAPEAVQAPAPEPAAEPAPPPSVAYIVQVGAYQRVEEADQTKALLALQGISSAIQRITKQGQGVWFRVVVGPYGTAQEAQSARVRVGDAGFKGMVLKSARGPG